MLSIPDAEGRTPLQDPDVFKLAIPLLKKFSPELIREVLHEDFKQGIPLFKELSPEEIRNIFNYNHKEGRPALQNPVVFKQVIPVLREMPELLTTILSIADMNERVPLQNPDIFEIAIPFLKELQPEQLKTILSIPIRKILLEIPDVFKRAIPFLKNLPQKELLDLLSIKNARGLTALNYAVVFRSAIPFLKELPPEKLIAIFSIQDSRGSPLIEDCDVFEKALPLLEELPINVLVACLSIKNGKGTMPLQIPHVFEKAIPLMEKLLTEGAALLGLHLHDPNFLKDIIQVLQRNLPPEQFINMAERFLNLLSIEVKKSAIEEYVPAIFLQLAHTLLLGELPSDQQTTLLAAFLSISDKDGKTPLQSRDVLTEAFPLLHRLSVEQRLKILSIEDKEGLSCTVLCTISQILKGQSLFFKNLPPEKLEIILSMKDKEGNSPLHYPELFEKPFLSFKI